MVFYTLVISLFNLAIGYFLALYLQSRGVSPGWLWLARISRSEPLRLREPNAAVSSGVSAPIVQSPPALAESVAQVKPPAPAEPVESDPELIDPPVKSKSRHAASWPAVDSAEPVSTQ